MIYADSSFLVALKVRRDTFHEEAMSFYGRRQEDTWLWSPWQRVEVFNTIRQLTRHPDSKRRLLLAEARALIHSLETDARIGYFTHMEADWRDVLRTANEISIAHAVAMPCLAPDLLHVAYAKELAAEWMVSFDEDQLELATATGLKAKKPS
ncbi:MAG: PIN domain-containing protein [Verrucomicrobiales bacterium]|nr:PIN domain-containing protein [Verrucomicrobiales bacterium]